MHEVFASGQLTNHFVVFSKGTVMGLFLVKLKSSLRKLYGRHHDLVDRYRIYG